MKKGGYFTDYSILGRSPLFRGIPAGDFGVLLEHLKAETRSYKKGDLICHAGEHTNALGIVLTGSVTIESDDIFALYNGKLVWTVDNGVLMASYPTERFLKVPETQGLFLLDSTNAPVDQHILSEWDVLKASDILLPKLTIAGTRDHRVTINFDAAGLTFPVTSGYKPVLVFYMDGFLVKGGCEFYDQKNPNAVAIGQW